MTLGKFNSKAHPVLSVFVLACSIVTVGLLFVMEKSEQARDSLTARAGYTSYLE